MSALLRVARSQTVRWLLPAAVVAAVVELALRTMTLPRLCRLLGVRLELGPGSANGSPHSVPVRALDVRDSARYRAARRVLGIWPWAGHGMCLRLALVAGFLLRHRQPALHLGVTHVDGKTLAHAWLSIDSAVLDPTAQYYTPLRERVS